MLINDQINRSTLLINIFRSKVESSEPAVFRQTSSSSNSKSSSDMFDNVYSDGDDLNQEDQQEQT
jgi:hypothetical protein